jgi:cell division protein FtsW (lipid II flippase)
MGGSWGFLFVAALYCFDIKRLCFSGLERKDLAGEFFIWGCTGYYCVQSEVFPLLNGETTLQSMD